MDYSKNGSGIGGQDQAWVDEIHFTPTAVAITSQPVNQNADTGETASFSVSVSGHAAVQLPVAMERREPER